MRTSEPNQEGREGPCLEKKHAPNSRREESACKSSGLVLKEGSVAVMYGTEADPVWSRERGEWGVIEGAVGSLT